LILIRAYNTTCDTPAQFNMDHEGGEGDEGDEGDAGVNAAVMGTEQGVILPQRLHLCDAAWWCNTARAHNDVLFSACLLNLTLSPLKKIVRSPRLATSDAVAPVSLDLAFASSSVL
jgi:hypothetical protein